MAVFRRRPRTGNWGRWNSSGHRSQRCTSRSAAGPWWIVAHQPQRSLQTLRSSPQPCPSTRPSRRQAEQVRLRTLAREQRAWFYHGGRSRAGRSRLNRSVSTTSRLQFFSHSPLPDHALVCCSIEEAVIKRARAAVAPSPPMPAFSLACRSPSSPPLATPEPTSRQLVVGRGFAVLRYDRRSSNLRCFHSHSHATRR
jgi:hypothetical protein